jgi:hypothetical protein
METKTTKPSKRGILFLLAICIILHILLIYICVDAVIDDGIVGLLPLVYPLICYILYIPVFKYLCTMRKN